MSKGIIPICPPIPEKILVTTKGPIFRMVGQAMTMQIEATSQISPEEITKITTETFPLSKEEAILAELQIIVYWFKVVQTRVELIRPCMVHKIRTIFWSKKRAYMMLLTFPEGPQGLMCNIRMFLIEIQAEYKMTIVSWKAEIIKFKVEIIKCKKVIMEFKKEH